MAVGDRDTGDRLVGGELDRQDRARGRPKINNVTRVVVNKANTTIALSGHRLFECQCRRRQGDGDGRKSKKRRFHGESSEAVYLVTTMPPGSPSSRAAPGSRVLTSNSAVAVQVVTVGFSP